MYNITDGEYQSPEQMLLELWPLTRDPSWERRFSWLMFSHATIYQGQKVCEKLVKYIHDNGLGKVTVTEPTTNPNSYHTIIVYLWLIDWPAYTKWVVDHTPQPKPMTWVRNAFT